MTAPRIQFTVYGDPAGQGNLKGTRHGKLRHANGDELLAWRGKVRQAAIDHTDAHEWRGEKKGPCRECGYYRTQHAQILGPVRLEAVLTVVKPKSVRTEWPISRGTSDWDHYARAIGDALTGIAYADDSQVIDGRAIVTYPHIHPDALHVPGAVIKLWPIEGDL
ncbi:RusA family crossover junction endodeoxyribonuclease [Nonomuraea sp. NPDC049750]|uniref:RusA family crossover junction endodeoxyribonuclease n=1 Tax=Nonomuraea sp. NPDC049750 TaxID=3154738 RepID=UPI0033C8CBFC